MNKSIFFIVYLLLSSVTYAQIKGVVKDDKGIVMSNVNVLLLDSIEEIETFAITNKNGEFIIEEFTLGSKSIQIKKSLYQTIEEDFVMDDKVIDLGIFTLLKEDAIALKEVIVKAEYNPYKNDTAEFDAAKYRTGKELNVEDLIKNIPGASVDKDGKIKIGKKSVQSVLVEGDDLFDSGYAILTQAMNDQSVAKIQVINNHTKNNLTKDIFDSDALAINLILDDKAKSKWNGNALLASTSYIENRHQLRLNLMNFTKKRKIFTLFNYNTIGFDEMKAVNYLIKNQFSSNYNFDQLNELNSLPNLANLYQANYQFDDNRTNFNNDKIGVLNLINNFKSSKIQVLGIYNRIEKNNYIDEIENFNDNDIQFSNQQKSHWNKKIDNYYAKLEWNKDLSKKSNLNITNRSYFLDEKNANNFLFNSSSINLKGSNETNSIETKGIYTNKLDSTKLLTILVNHLYQNRPYQFTEKNPIFSTIFNHPDLVYLNQKIKNQQNYLGLKASLFNKISKKDKFYLTFGVENQTVNLVSDFNLLNSDFISTMSFDQNRNNLKYNQSKIYIIPALEKKWKRFEFKLALPINYYSTSLNEDQNLNEDHFFVSPKLDINYEKLRVGNISLTYEYQLHPTNFEAYYKELIYKGNREFSKSNLSNYEIFGGSIFQFQFSKLNGLNKGFEIGFMYQNQNESVGYNSIYDPNFAINEVIIVKGIEVIKPSVMYKRFINAIKSKIQFNGDYTVFKSQTIANQNYINNFFYSAVLGIEMKSGFSGIWNYTLGSKLSFNTSKNDFNTFNYTNYDAFLNLYFKLTKQFYLDVNYEHYNFGGQNQKATNFLDMKLNYQLKDSKIKLFIHGNNLLNTKEISRTVVTPVTEQFFTQRLLPLHILLGMQMNF